MISPGAVTVGVAILGMPPATSNVMTPLLSAIEVMGNPRDPPAHVFIDGRVSSVNDVTLFVPGNVYDAIVVALSLFALPPASSMSTYWCEAVFFTALDILV